MSRLSRSRSILAVLAVTATLAGGSSAVALAQHDTSAVAVNTNDGSSVFRLAFSFVQVVGDTADETNSAIAYSSCNACQTVAISIQILLIRADLTTFAPVNQAIAINENCTSCDTLASAYQFAIGVGTKLTLTGDGRRQVADIRQQLEGLRNSGLSGPEIQSRLDTLMGQLGGVLQNDLAAKPQPAESPPSSTDTTPTSTDTTPTNTDTTPTSTDTTPTGTDTTPTSTDATPTGTDTTPTSTDTTPSQSGTTDTTTTPPPPSG